MQNAECGIQDAKGGMCNERAGDADQDLLHCEPWAFIIEATRDDAETLEIRSDKTARRRMNFATRIGKMHRQNSAFRILY